MRLRKADVHVKQDVFMVDDSVPAPLRYLATLTWPRIVLWCYLIWWLLTVSRHFDASPQLWLSSLGLCAIIGTALYLSTAFGGRVRTTLDRWQVFRLYLMPFCVSSFAALIKNRGFVLVFEPTVDSNLQNLACCAVFIACARALHAMRMQSMLRGR
jgi:hypothetical protein